jgi:hypothetical protein
MPRTVVGKRAEIGGAASVFYLKHHLSAIGNMYAIATKINRN